MKKIETSEIATKSLLERSQEHWVLVSFLFSLITFLLGVVFNTVLYSPYGLDYFLFYDLSDYLKVTLQSLWFWVIIGGCMALVAIGTLGWYVQFKEIYLSSNHKPSEKLAASFKVLASSLFLILIVALAGSIFNHQTLVDFERTTKGFKDHYFIKTRTNDLFNCTNIIDMNSENVFVWDHRNRQATVIPKSNIAIVSLLHDAMPSKGIERLATGGSNGGGHEPPRVGESYDPIQNITSAKKRYNDKVIAWYKSVHKVCPERVKKQDVIDRLYNFKLYSKRHLLDDVG